MIGIGDLDLHRVDQLGALFGGAHAARRVFSLIADAGDRAAECPIGPALGSIVAGLSSGP